MEIYKSKNWSYFLYVVIISLAGFLIRYVNTNYASLWADELYSAILANPENSWYEVLYIQRAYQPPLYAFSLWVWVKIFAYNEYYIRLFTLLAGVASISMSAALGKKIHSTMLGIVLAVLVAFSPVQIWYSLEARFYVFVYLFAVASLWFYWHTLTVKKIKGWVYIVKAFIDAALCYFHHFGLIFVFTQFLYDVILYLRTRDKKRFLANLGGYLLCAILYFPWIFWGLSEAIKVEQYWLKEIDIPAYLKFSFQYPELINYGCFIVIGYFLWKTIKQPGHYMLFPLICVVVTIVPVLYSYIKMPMLVARYAMVMSPAVYVMLGLGIVYLLDFLKSYFNKFLITTAAVLTLIFVIPGLHFSLKDKHNLDKQPWREMGHWLNKQNDINEVKIYSIGAYVKNKKNIDFYLNSRQPSLHVNDIIPGKDTKMYLVETDGVWKIKDSVMQRLDSFYSIQKQVFNVGTKTGSIYTCTTKMK